MDTLPDLINEHVHILSVGLNPSLPSVKAGFYFANPRNRYWKALNACGHFSQRLEPSLKSCEILLNQYNIGQTDLVKRPTAGGKDLRAADYREGNTRLNQLIEQLSPAVIWFHGKLTCQKYLQYEALARKKILFPDKAKMHGKREFTGVNDRLSTFLPKVGALATPHGSKRAFVQGPQYNSGKNPTITWGKQAWQLNTSTVFISPNPSPANAAYSLKNISDSYADLFQSIKGVQPC